MILNRRNIDNKLVKPQRIRIRKALEKLTKTNRRQNLKALKYLNFSSRKGKKTLAYRSGFGFGFEAAGIGANQGHPQMNKNQQKKKKKKKKKRKENGYGKAVVDARWQRDEAFVGGKTPSSSCEGFPEGHLL
jgi:hypothetical protein